MLSNSQKRALDFVEGVPFKEKFLNSGEIARWMQSIRDLNNVKSKDGNTQHLLKKIPSLSEAVVEMRNANR